MEIHSSILAWRISWTEKPGELQSLGSQRIGHDGVTNTHTRMHNKNSGSSDRIYFLELQNYCGQ